MMSESRGFLMIFTRLEFLLDIARLPDPSADADGTDLLTPCQILKIFNARQFRKVLQAELNEELF